MIFKVLENGQIWIQFILEDHSIKAKSLFEVILSQIGTYKYIEFDIIEFESTCFVEPPNMIKARSFVESLNEKLENISIESQHC